MDQYDFDPADAGRTQKQILESLAAMPDFASLINLGAYHQAQENGFDDAKDLSQRRAVDASSLALKLPYFASAYGSSKPEKNKKCQVCGKHARTPSDLLRHMRVHTGERPFPCVACAKTFKCKRSQLTHQYLSHGIRDGLSEHRLGVLDQRRTTRKPPSRKEPPPSAASFLAQMQLGQFMLQQQQQQQGQQENQPGLVAPPQDQDEDTEIMAEEEISCSNDGPVSFVGLFSSASEDHQHHEADNRMGNQQETCSKDRSTSKEMVKDKHGRREGGATTVAQLLQKKRKDRSKKVPVLRIKTHKCTHCRRQFRSIYTLRYHLRSMHDEKVYLSPALETRLKKRRWIPPHVRLQKSKLHSKKTKYHREKHHNKFSFPALPTYPNEEIEQKFYAQAAQNFADSAARAHKNSDPLDLHVNAPAIEIKKEKAETYEEEINNNVHLNSSEKNIRNLLGMSEKELKQFPYFSTATHQDNTAASSAGTFPLNGTSTNSNNSNPFMLPPHIFFPSSPNGEEALLNEKPISWESLQVTAESILIAKIEAVHPATQQKYVLYKCGLCGKAYASLRVICGHLTLHTASSKEKDCEKCGASFKWQTELDSHMECHQVSDRKFLSSQFLPSYYVNPFSIPVVSPSEQNVLNSTRLLPYPFFPMPQQMPPLVQPGFFPFFTTASLQQHQPPTSVTSDDNPPRNASPGNVPSENPAESLEDKNAMQGCNFQCKMCPKTFDRIFSLQRHERIHSGVKACFCKICGRGFSELRNLRHHIIRFHADSAQKEPLPYRRRPNRVRNVSSSQKLVTFLKKTAVRILNSMGQSKLDPLSPPTAAKNSLAKQEKGTAELSPAADRPENLSETTGKDAENADEKCGAFSTMPKLCDATSQATEPAPNQDLNEVPPPKLSPGVTNEVTKSSSSKTGRVEVLQDPKRSLLGNRRKGRPFKLTSTSNHSKNMGVEDMLFSFSDSSFLAKHAAAITESSLLQATEFLNGCLKQEMAFPQLNFFNMNMPQGLPPTLGLQEPVSNAVEKDHSQNSENSDEAAGSTDPQDPLPNEPLDMSNPTAKEKDATPPLLPEFDAGDSQAKSILLNQDAKNRLSVYNDPASDPASLKLPESFESQCLFPCSYCHKSFNSIADINRHMSFHADIRPFKCPYCNYCSRTNSQLKVHMMRHEGIKHYMCQVCNYNGVTQSDLNRHLKTRTHLLRSRNVCSCCGTGFHTRSLSEEHYKSCVLQQSSSKNGLDQNQKSPPEASASVTGTVPAAQPSNRNRVTRLKQFRAAPDDKIKNEFYQKLCDINSMGVTFGDFLQQSAAAIKVEK